MMNEERRLALAKRVAVEAAQAAGRHAKSRFASEYAVAEKGDHGDLVTDVDIESERIILDAIRAEFPDDEIRSEESGWSGVQGDWLWLVDPLDGTNNFAIGLPAFGVAITLLHRRRPVLGVVHESMTDRTYCAVEGQGAECNGMPFIIGEERAGKPLLRRTVGWIQGHQVQKDPEAMRLKSLLDESCKRSLRLWAPALLWTMLARGQLDGIVLYDSEGDDLYAGVLIAKEAGASVVRFDGSPFDGMDDHPFLVAGRGDGLRQLLELVRRSEGA
ncbi:inositol monophosphatase [Paenibacillus sp.]|uniref:inositol monophosphatase family protein n=1 Tax=Paenibacillus sp. TaxID=58172 RepID=UPI002D60D2DE|nr:inositol monophosphatase [Paenibacillus sp.]HZG85087.1 inositol monophosphatase [Paenibacillus sp.]